MSKYYSEIVQGSLSNRGSTYILNKKVWELDYYGKDVKNGFSSTFLHTKEFSNYTKKNSSVRGYTGKVESECLYFDIDNSDLSMAWDSTKKLYSYIIQSYGISEQNILLSFSGKKGFHVVVVVPELGYIESDHKVVVKKTCLKMAEEAGVVVDDKVYNRTSLIRTMNSQHPSGLYKIQVETGSSIDEILELAKEQQEMDFDPYTDDMDNGKIVEILSLFAEDEGVDTPPANSNTTGGYSNVSGGNRNVKMTSLCGVFLSKGFSGSLLKEQLMNTNLTYDPPLEEREIDVIINSVSKYGVKQEYKEVKGSDIKTFKQAGKEYRRVKRMSGDFTWGDRFGHINKAMESALLGDNMGVFAFSSVGKTTIGMDMANSYAKMKNVKVGMINLEMADYACFYKGAQIHAEADDDGKISNKTLTYNIMQNDDYFESVCKEYENMVLYTKPVNLEQLNTVVARMKEEYDVKMIVLDYMQNIKGASDINKAMDIFRGVKDIWKEHLVYGLTIIQANKTGVNPYAELDVNHIEGVGGLYQALDYLMCFWKVTGDNSRLHGKMLKVRWEEGDGRFDVKRTGLKHHTVDFIKDTTYKGGFHV